MSYRGVGRGRRTGRVHGQGSGRTVSFPASIFGDLSKTVMEDDGTRANLEGEVAASTETDHLQTMLSGSRHVQTQESFVDELITTVPNVGPYAFP